MGTERDFVVKKGLKVAEGITLGGHTFDDIDIGSEFVDTDDHIMSSGAIKEYVDANAGGIASLADDSSPQLGANLDTAGYDITSTSNQHIGIVPHGSGDVRLDADTIRLGDSNTDVKLTTNGTSDLTIDTNNGTNSGSIVIADGANADINIAPNGTGSLLVNYSASNNNYGMQVASNAENVVPFSSTNKTTATNSIQTTGHFTNAITSGSRTTGFGSQIEFRLGEINYAGYLAGKIGAKMQDTGNANFDMFITPSGTGNLALGNFTLDADQTVGSGQDNYVMTYDHSAGTIGLEAAGGGDSWGDEVDANIIPDTNNTYTLGSASKKFGSVYFAGTSYNTLLSSANGSASYPTYTFEVDENTGMYRGGADTLGFSTGGTARLTIGSNGEVTIPGQMTSRANVVAVSSNTTLTLAQSGSYVYWTGGTLTLPASGTVGTQYTVINNKGSAASITLNGTNCSMISGFTNAPIADHELASFVCVTANNWILVG